MTGSDSREEKVMTKMKQIVPSNGKWGPNPGGWSAMISPPN